ncbi:unnamed protein product [Rotaria sp. Silwood2]|nr:unnamed protein product [Rotaria sp. Silwood2]CAF2695409.1 unnamed protein product [Rotaria sp. Silwood2]CAF2945042.1 unnamed protein product [Rotaria sp. Silwood2]CAF3089503.1 unnamed protein product [Rotaria sp. Silwood2]CAF4030353.1 unnamed protein product [Rotaria sp. Silwood2]
METDIDDLSFHLSTLRTTPNEIAMLDNRQPISTYILPSMSSCPMATDNYNHLLIYHHQTLILLSLPKFEVIFSIAITPFIESPISDMCFHSILNCFLLSSSNTIYSLSSNRQIEIIHKFSNIIWSITNTSKYIFICYLFGFSIEQWEFNSNNGNLLNTWLKDSLIESLDIGINCIRAVNQYLGMTIKENNFSWRIDIFDVLTMNKIRRGRTIQQENDFKNWIGILYPMDHYRWLFADGDQGLYLIDQTDPQEYKQNNIKKVACNICLIHDINSKTYSSIVVQSYEALHLYDLQ